MALSQGAQRPLTVLQKDSQTKDLLPSPPLTEESRSNDSSSYDSLSNQSSEDDASVPLPPPSTVPMQVLPVDLETPDNLVPRDARLIRLTGVHPFNVEAPLTALFDEGFLTSPELFYVRNHGAVPHVPEEDIPDWEFSVEGLVENPIRITLTELIEQYEQITSPVTLVCAGNRRKEQNVVRKSKGFSWGAAGLSTALFTGVMMADVIKKARPTRKAKYVCMEGADKLPNGYYGTSVKLNWVLDSNRGIMLSYQMNGEMLRPDHGKPLRAVIPGQIGGRSVKWLKKIIVTDAPSDNWYHIYDNRVLPTTVSPEESAKEPKWWLDERYAIYDLSPNSAICYPAHGETLSLNSGKQQYCAKGYAYSGGGRRITRVELSLDKGVTWRLANIDYPEDRYRDVDKTLFGGRIDMSWRENSFCWCQWAVEFSLDELKDAKDIVLRSMDESMCIQPRDMYWSVLGMMNNPWFRVTITRDGDQLRFDHPTLPALMSGGWMEKVKKEGGNLTNGYWGESIGEEDTKKEIVPVQEVSMVKEGLKNVIEIDEFRKHGEKDSPWFVVNGEVYDGTNFLQGHPGGATSIISAAGQDAMDEFMAIHSETAKGMMPTYHVGTLSDAAKKALAEPADAGDASQEPRATFLQSKAWSKALLYGKKIVSWDTRIFTYQLDHDQQTLGLPVGQHLMVRLKDGKTNDNIIRSYTPISEINDKGFMEMLVKVYFDGEGVQGGKMSQAMDALAIGDTIEMKGPIGKFEYLGYGRCTVQGLERKVSKFVMICGGSGITPIYQVFRAVMQNPADETKCVVLNGNRQFEDILCKPELDGLAKDNDHRCKLIYTLTKAPEAWDGLRGRIDANLVNCHCDNDPEALILICGPTALEKAMHKVFNDKGWSDDQLLFF